MVDTKQNSNNVEQVPAEKNSLNGLNILDGSAGLGVDSFLLAKAGATIKLIEKNPIVYTLLKDGFDRIKEINNSDVKDIVSRMELLERGDCYDYMNKISQNNDNFPDIVYLDLMQHQKKKRSKHVASSIPR